MTPGIIQVYSGDGHGKSPAALGRALQAAADGKRVVIIQFLKARETQEAAFFQKLEPEIKMFRFEKSEEDFARLTEEQKAEEACNLKNGMNFAKKVLSTGECDLLILDEVLGLIDNRIVTVEDLKNVLSCKTEETTVILTGIQLTDEICMLADEVSKIETVKFKVW